MRPYSLTLGSLFCLAACTNAQQNVVPLASAGESLKHPARLALADVKIAVLLGQSSISPGSKSIAIVLKSVDGKPPSEGIVTSVIAPLPQCASGCRVAGPSVPPGTDAFAFTTFDAANGKGHRLAVGSTVATIVSAKSNVIVAGPLGKIPAFLSLGTIPSGSPGTPASLTVPLTVFDADHHAIVGTYATPVIVSDNDTSPATAGSSLGVNGVNLSRSVQLTTSSAAASLKLVYGGLAMLPVQVTAHASGTRSVTASFKTTSSNIEYSGPTNAGSPEVDLYNAPGQSGSQGSFGLSEPGWSGGAFTNGFTYTLGGTNNNCGSFAITPASGAGSSFTVAAISTAFAGECTMTLTGAPNANAITVTLTYTSTNIGVDGRHRREGAP